MGLADFEIEDYTPTGQAFSIGTEQKVDISETTKKDYKYQPIDVDKTSTQTTETYSPQKSFTYSPTIVTKSPSANVTGATTKKEQRVYSKPTQRTPQTVTPRFTQPTRDTFSDTDREEEGGKSLIGGDAGTLLVIGAVGVGAYFLLSGDNE